MLSLLEFVSWNARGLGRQDKCTDVKAALSFPAPNFICLQESKLQVIDSFKASSFLPNQVRSFVFIPSLGASGGVITAWNDLDFSCDSTIAKTYSLTTKFSSRTSDLQFTLTNVYGPRESALKQDFIDEILSLLPLVSGPWAVLGDFNMTLSPLDRSNDNFDAAEAARFAALVDSLKMMEIPLLDRLYTWSNMQRTPILVKLDRVFINTDWNFALPDSTLSSRTRCTSDHVPISLSTSAAIPRPDVFRLNNYLLKSQPFRDVVQRNWLSVGRSPCHSGLGVSGKLCLRLKRVRAAAKSWCKQHRSPLQIAKNCDIVISLLDRLEEARPFSVLEARLRVLVLDSLQKHNAVRASFWRQRAKIRNCIFGDENSAYFHACASNRLRRNQIKVIEVQGVPVFSHSGKESILLNFFKQLVGTVSTVSSTLNLHLLFRSSSISPSQATSLVAPFSMVEIKSATFGMDVNSSPGPDGFGPAFFKENWNLVKDDLFVLLGAFHASNTDLRRLNKSYIVLLPKRLGATSPEQFRPVSLQNFCVKLCSKCLTNRLQPLIPYIINPDQTGFIKGRSIAKKFIYVADIVQSCHKRKAPAIVLKLDFRKAFDSISWEALDRIMRAMGFPPLWCDWVGDLNSSSQSAILLNGKPSPWFSCRKGLRQGDPLSPYLFLKVAELLRLLLRAASDQVTFLTLWTTRFRALSFNTRTTRLSLLSLTISLS
jgi:exonuclease III